MNYDEIAGTFDARYRAGLYDGILVTLVDLINAKRPTSALEVGCGTGHWLSTLRESVAYLCGIDRSLEMLRRAVAKCPGAGLLRATARALPLRDASVDLVFCVNAIHHFERFEEFIVETKRLLRPAVRWRRLGWTRIMDVTNGVFTIIFRRLGGGSGPLPFVRTDNRCNVARRLQREWNVESRRGSGRLDGVAPYWLTRSCSATDACSWRCSAMRNMRRASAESSPRYAGQNETTR